MVEILELKKNILEENAADADEIRRSMKEKGVLFINLMSSPGAGKTTMLLKTLKSIGVRKQIGIMEADIDSDVDAEKIRSAGGRTIQLHTGGMCHLDAEMVQQGLAHFPHKDLDILFLENVGNLVCPAEFDTGAEKNVMILSVPEGDDKPLKYPLMFSIADVVLINKIDCAPYFDFDPAKFRENVRRINPHAVLIPICAKTGEGMTAWTGWLDEQCAELRGR